MIYYYADNKKLKKWILHITCVHVTCVHVGFIKFCVITCQLIFKLKLLEKVEKTEERVP